jgi:hypothetical protein
VELDFKYLFWDFVGNWFNGKVIVTMGNGNESGSYTVGCPLGRNFGKLPCLHVGVRGCCENGGCAEAISYGYDNGLVSG